MKKCVSTLVLILNLLTIQGLSNDNDSLFLLFKSGDYEAVTNLAYSILDTAESNETKGVACKYLGNAFAKLGKYDKAEEYYKKSLSYDNQSTTLSNLGILYYRQGKLDEAELHFNRAIELSDDDKVKARTMGNLVILDMERENYDNALILSKKLQKIFLSLNDSLHFYAALINEAEIYSEINDYGKSDSLFKKILSEFESQSSYPDLKTNVYYNLFILNLNQKNIDSAYHYHLAWEELTNELTGESVQKQLAEQEQAYENKILKIENREKSFRLQATIWGGIGVLIFVGLGIFLFYNYRETKRLRMVKVFADRWESESQKIARWLTEDMGQRFMAMRFMYESGNDQLLKVADEGLDMLETMSDHLYNIGVEGTGIKVSLEGLVVTHQQSHSTDIELVFEGIRNLQHIPHEVKIYTILRDLLGATTKHPWIKILVQHSDKTQITVSLEREAEVIKAILEPRVIGVGRISVNKNTINLLIK